MCSSFSRSARVAFILQAAPSIEAATWVTQQARQLVWKQQAEGRVLRFLLHDRDATFSPGFYAVCASERINVMLTRLACAE
jgi:hypothetical protein